MRLAPAAVAGQTLPERRRLQAAIKEVTQYHEVRLSRLSRNFQTSIRNQEQTRRQSKATFQHLRGFPFHFTSRDLKSEMQNAARGLEHFPETGRGIAIGSIILLFVPVVLSLVSVLLFRRSLRSLVLGIDIVRRDGRPAGRLRCAWRVLVAWLPLVVVMGVARGLEEWYWDQWTPAFTPPAWLLQMADVLWLAAFVLPLVYLLVILITPARSIHDRLSGTWLVPR
jgi:hypothetical protein